MDASLLQNVAEARRLFPGAPLDNARGPAEGQCSPRRIGVERSAASRVESA
jgi:hypothetical protein